MRWVSGCFSDGVGTLRELRVIFEGRLVGRGGGARGRARRSGELRERRRGEESEEGFKHAFNYMINFDHKAARPLSPTAGRVWVEASADDLGNPSQSSPVGEACGEGVEGGAWAVYGVLGL